MCLCLKSGYLIIHEFKNPTNVDILFGVEGTSIEHSDSFCPLVPIWSFEVYYSWVSDHTDTYCLDENVLLTLISEIRRFKDNL